MRKSIECKTVVLSAVTQYTGRINGLASASLRADEVESLRVFPDQGFAYWECKGHPHCAVYVEFIPIDFASWESEHICEVCGETFATGQALGSHRASQHVAKLVPGQPAQQKGQVKR